MRTRIWDRIGSVSWAAYLALLVAAYAVLPKPMVGDTTNVAGILAYFGAHQGLIRAYAALGGLGNLFLLIFVAHLAGRLRGGRGAPDFSLLALASGAGVVLFEFAIIGTQLALAVAAAAATAGAGILGMLFSSLVVAGMFLLGLYFAAVGAAILASGVFPTWFGWTSYAAAVLEITIAVLVTLGVARVGLVSLLLAIVWIAGAGILSTRLERRLSLQSSVAAPA